jgi:7,8-dihydroneopterin aldolase/epimerase/oxygenase
MNAVPLPTTATSWPTDATHSAPLDLIFIEGFVGETVIGIHDSELHRPQPLRIDVTAGLPRARACDTDQIADTIDYGVVRDRLRRLLVEHKLTLLESFAETVAEILIDEFGAHWVRVVVVKPKKFDDVDAVGVAIERRRNAALAATPRAGATVLSLIGAGMVPGGA